MDKRFWIIVGILIVGFVGYLLFQGNGKTDTSTASSVKPTSHTRGNEQSSVNLTEYGDFQCPACASYFPLVEQVYEKYQDKIVFQFRHFPLTAIHPNAFAGSRAAEAAAKQGKFWEMYTQLYTNQQAWSGASSPNAFFDAYSKDIGLDEVKFKKDFASREVNDLIKADEAAGKKLDVTATPTFFLNGKKIENAPQSLDGFSKLIDEALASQSANKNQSN